MVLGTALAGLLLPGCGKTVQEQVLERNRTGVSWLLQRDFAAAEAEFREALALAPEDFTTQYNLAVAAHLRGRTDEAERWYRRCLAQDPHFLPARRGLAHLLWQENRQEELRQFVMEWIRDRPDSADAHALHGWYLARLGDYPAAEAALQSALLRQPQHPFALAELGRIYELYRYPERARSLYERSLHYDPWQPELRARWAKLQPSSWNR
ncbi:MAG: tetratricopeptide repeat protein [Gemmatales bacterium]|nr:tetratricopeptide repeat protein [Gemmatales bacterium]MDW8175666.1 tetratricopeptide repeat protein [Gemmatales bacterium]